MSNSPSPPRPEGATPLLAQLFVRSDAPAFISNGEVWTRARLSVQADRLAAGFAQAGVQVGDRVALNLRNGPELVIAYLACLRIGAIAAPLRQGLKTRELETMLRRLRPALYLGHADLYAPVALIGMDVLGETARFVVGIAGDGSARPWTDLQLHDRPPERGIDPEAPAALMATTGTTGEPKLVAHSHASLAAIAKQGTYLGVVPGQVIGFLNPMGHMGGLAFLLASLCNGAVFVILDATDPDGTLDGIEAHHCTYLPGIPIVFGRLVDAQRRHPRNMASLQVCYSLADVCPPATEEAFEAAFGQPLRSAWGMTEVVGPLTYGAQPGSVFRPLPNVEIRLVDDDDNEVAVGQAGEFVVRGACVSLGYWTGPGAVDSFEDGWCRTGDIMRQDACGNIWFISRAKDLLKRNGQFVSPAEVEGILSAHAAVRDAGVAGLPDGDHGQRLIGFIQLADGAGPAALQDILESASPQLADHKLPELLVPVQAIPRNALGKIDRKQLALLDDAGLGIKCSGLPKQAETTFKFANNGKIQRSTCMIERPTQQTIAYRRMAEPQNSIAYMGSVLAMLATGEDTQGRFAVVEAKLRPGNEPPPHYHEWEHEFYYLLAGEIEFHCGEKKLCVRAGEVMFLPQGALHGFYILTPLVRTLIMAVSTDERPVGLDRYFLAMGEPTTTMQLPSGAITHATADPSRAVQIAAAAGTMIVPPEEARRRLPNYPGFGAARLA